jgi:general secretion pathway protein M
MSLQAYYEKLEPRERRLLLGLGGVVVAFVFLLLPISVYGAVSNSRERNQELRDLVAQIEAARGQVAERRAKHDAVLARYAKPTPPLATFIEEAARANDLAVPESQDKPEIPHGKRYTERITVVKMHKIGMRNLAKMLEKIETSGHPVSVSRLNIKPRPGEPDSYEVELGVSAFDRKSEPPSGAAPAAGSAEPEAGEEEP